MAAAPTTWLSPRFDRANVLSKAIKVSPLFAPGDGWRFDDHDEKQYIDPEKNCHSRDVTNIQGEGGGVLPHPLSPGERRPLFFPHVFLLRREISKQHTMRVRDTAVYCEPQWQLRGGRLTNVGCVAVQTGLFKTVRGGLTRGNKLAAWLDTDLHWGWEKGGGPLPHDSAPCKYSVSPMTLFTVKNS